MAAALDGVPGIAALELNISCPNVDKGGIEIGQLDVMGPAIDAIDHRIGSPFQLVIEPTLDQPADDRAVETLGGKHIACGATLDPLLGQSPVHALDDIAALSQLAQRCLGITADRPLPRADLVGEAERFQLPEPPDFEGLVFVGLTVGMRREVDGAGIAGIADKLSVELGPALGIDLPFEGVPDVVIGARPQFHGDEIARPVAHPLLDVVARDHEVVPVVADPTHDQMDMGMFGVPVIDGHPIETRAEVLFHLPDEIAREGFEIRHLERVVGRDDEAEMVPVVAAALGEGPPVGGLRLRPEQTRLLPVPGHALAAEVIEMRAQRRGATGMAHNARLDHGAP